MTLQQDRIDAGQRNSPPERTPRLRLKPKAPQSGYVDGAWWPRSDDLATELPDLLAVLSVRLGHIDRVLYNVDEWPKPSRKLATGGRQVRLDGYRRQPTNTIEVLGLTGSRIGLLVVPPDTEPDVAHEAMMTAAAPNNASVAGNLLAVGAEEQQEQVALKTCYHPTFHRRVRRFAK
jgi:hypothetical protein